MNERLNDRGLQKWQGMIFPEQKALFNEMLRDDQRRPQ